MRGGLEAGVPTALRAARNHLRVNCTLAPVQKGNAIEGRALQGKGKQQGRAFGGPRNRVRSTRLGSQESGESITQRRIPRTPMFPFHIWESVGTATIFER